MEISKVKFLWDVPLQTLATRRKKNRYIPSGQTEKKIQSLEFSREFDTRTDIKEKWKKKLQ